MKALGLHLLIELHNCDSKLLNNEAMLRKILYTIARRSGMTPLKDSFHAFTPHGVSGVVLLAESHVSVHTWPELGYAAVDFFTCNLETDLSLVERMMLESFKPSHHEVIVQDRGEHVHVPQRVICAD
ncbi:MAG TPA: adenosylmethionine decarboxylase [Thermoanaerobaculia bacterium]|nr:adenosylmethionine decarboxylase [Thermoanaerobaculia bacterium]HUM29013.1 adenosylmethionine decarboxylase [Thermoanaerobaculia bacterium]HXK67431.1 adenosylmethionine decarboxylase [Thermoanaerobaculia bacterium]